MKIGVMRGHLREFDLGQVLQVVGIGRQYTGVEVRNELQTLGTIFVKSGMIVQVEADGEQGREALFKLFRNNDGQFVVFRMQTPEPLPEPIGGVNGLLMEAIDRMSPLRMPTVIPPGRASQRIEASSSVHSSVPSAERTATRQPARPLGMNGSHPRSGRVVAVVSPKGGCGKTTIALNVALSLARQGRSVVLVDADVNGDVLSAINSRARAEIGLYDVLDGSRPVRQALLDTLLPHFKILPAVGRHLPRSELLNADQSARFASILAELAERDSVVIVDTPAGMLGGITPQILRASTHVIGVLQAEQIAGRSFSRFQDALGLLDEATRPAVVGIVINMLQTKHDGSISVFQRACKDLPEAWLFDTSIPRHRVFLDSSHAGVPLRNLDEQAPPAVAWLFDNLAAEVAERLQLAEIERKPQALLL